MLGDGGGRGVGQWVERLVAWVGSDQPQDLYDDDAGEVNKSVLAKGRNRESIAPAGPAECSGTRTLHQLSIVEVV